MVLERVVAEKEARLFADVLAGLLMSLNATTPSSYVQSSSSRRSGLEHLFFCATCTQSTIRFFDKLDGRMDNAASQSSDLFGPDDPTFLEALARAVLPGDVAMPDVEAENLGQLVALPAEMGPRGTKRSWSPPPARSPSPLDEGLFRSGYGSLKSIIHLNTEDEEPSSYLDSDTYGASKFNGWGDYMRRKRAKLQVQNDEMEEQNEANGSAGKPKIFRGLAIHINGFTIPSVQVLRGMITQNGGTYHAYLDKKGLVTHVVASNLTPAKVLEFKHMKIVTPDWITKSVEAGLLLPWRDFILHPSEMDRLDEAQGSRTAQKTLLEGFQTQARRATQQTSVPHRPQRTTILGCQKPSSPGTPQVQQPATDTLMNNPPDISDSHARESLSGLDDVATTSGTAVDPAECSSNISDGKEIGQSTSANVRLMNEMSGPKTPTKQKRSILDGPFVAGTKTPESPEKKTSPTTVDCSTDPVTHEAAAHIPAHASFKSNPNAARLMQNPRWAAKHTSAKGAEFIEGFYKQSRLHHLSTWKAELKELVAKAQAKLEDDQSREHEDGPDKGVSMAGHVLPEGKARLDSKGRVRPEDRVIMHCDFDSFFVAASLIDRPHLKGKPVVVCHSQGKAADAGTGRTGSSTSEVASASYEARKFGIRNGMSLGQARKLCPELETLPYEFEKYKEFSLKFYTILMTYADDVQAVSVDEALIDVSNAVARARFVPCVDGEGGPPNHVKELAEAIRDDVRKSTGCEISIGASHNILLARLATRRAKPAGSCHILPEDVSALLEDLDIKDLHGVGWSISERMDSNLGIKKVGELAKQPKATLQKLFGPKMGEKLFNAARGIDNAQIESHKQRKSVSAEVNYGIRFETEEQAERFMHDLGREVSRRLKNVGMKGRFMTLKLMKRHHDAPLEAPKFMGHGICDTFSKSAPITARGGTATDDPDIIGEEAWKLLKSFGFDSKELRGLGIQIQKLEGGLGQNTPPVGQGILDFQKVASPSKRSRQASGDNEIPTGPQSGMSTEDEQMTVKAEEQEEVLRPVTLFELPSFAQIDLSVLDALPADIRAEVEAEYVRPRPRLPSELPQAGPSVVSPVKAERSPPDVKHITRQLAPKRNGNRPPPKYSIFQKRETTPVVQVEITDGELRELQIDPEVFRALPGDLQREQLAAHKGTLHLPPRVVAARSTKPARESRSPSVPARRSKQVYQAVFPQDPELGRMSETSAIRELIEQWFVSSVDSGPHEKDLKRIGDFLVKCLEGDVGMEKGVVVMQWWKHLIEARWVSDTHRSAGKLWWDAFTGIKRRLDEVVKRRFGGTLSLD
ncbi:DNA repair protein [Dacryopinax primogenitus]|uniref:DNA repair protein REV1 n=1 Tax=Dacryopinax primogenitus (strain DJM 731) TaxID=1858805 RepID=M5GAE6_DACPD|nr:DNA repair protein [Dacryopinax primogenitus]EJU05804.1 DNA repair protein [Dacryopinax primogenitus]